MRARLRSRLCIFQPQVMELKADVTPKTAENFRVLW